MTKVIVNGIRMGRADRDVMDIIDAVDGPCSLSFILREADWEVDRVINALNRLEKYGALVRLYERDG